MTNALTPHRPCPRFPFRVKSGQAPARQASSSRTQALDAVREDRPQQRQQAGRQHVGGEGPRHSATESGHLFPCKGHAQHPCSRSELFLLGVKRPVRTKKLKCLEMMQTPRVGTSPCLGQRGRTLAQGLRRYLVRDVTRPMIYRHFG